MQLPLNIDILMPSKYFKIEADCVVVITRDASNIGFQILFVDLIKPDHITDEISW